MNDEIKTINIGKDFSTDPRGRYRTDSNSSGEAFREDILLPILKSLKQGECVHIIIDDGVEGYGFNFLEEAFGKIVTDGYFSCLELLSKIVITYSDKEYRFFEEMLKSIFKPKNNFVADK